MYNSPTGTPNTGTASTIGSQIRTDYHQKKALIELVKEQYFSPLADVTTMPKHFGKKIKLYHYMPLLDDRNINDQGIDAAGVAITSTQFFVQFPALTFIVADANKVAAAAAVNDNINNAGTAETIATAGADGSGGGANAVITLTKQNVKYLNTTKAAAVTAFNIGAIATAGGGNLYGSSKDIGTISSKLPALSETGGRVNRVGFKRLEIEGTFEKFGFFEEYTQESLDFDTDDELESHINREMLRGAGEMTEDALQIDLLNSASTIRYAGVATSNATMTGVAANTVSEVDYDDLQRLAIILDDNRTPKQTKVITGSRMVDTKTIRSGRILYIGSELIPTVERMVDYFSNAAFIPVQHYASAGDSVNGEIGSIGAFRIVVVPEMLHWAGVGATEGTNAGYRATNGKYNVYPMLCVGEGSFTTIGFYTDGKSVKFKIYHKKPGQDTVDKTDPFGESGLMSIKWYYGFMALRAERLGLIKTVARV
jgi:N4-gp56 family major capsid protein